MRRLSLEVTHVKPELWCSDIEVSCSIDGPLWGRRSHYRVARHPLLVCEFFLPQLLQLEHRVFGQTAV
jgi:chorismate lyase